MPHTFSRPREALCGLRGAGTQGRKSVRRPVGLLTVWGRNRQTETERKEFTMPDQMRCQMDHLGASAQEQEQERGTPMTSTLAREVAIEAAQAGGAILRAAYRTGSTRVREKADQSLQTEADLAAE